jgi:hypothetical protein
METKRKVSWAVKAGLAFLAIGLYGALSSTRETPSVDAASDFTRLGYFKDAHKNRLMTYRMGGQSADQVRAHAEALLQSEGARLGAYYYANGARIPDAALTLARDYRAARAVVMDSADFDAFRFVFLRLQSGKAIFIDCRDDAWGECR